MRDAFRAVGSDVEVRALPFARRKGYQLVAVGKGLGELNVHDRARLPSALKALYHLARLDRTVLLNLIEQGAIHPTMTVRKAEELCWP